MSASNINTFSHNIHACYIFTQHATCILYAQIYTITHFTHNHVSYMLGIECVCQKNVRLQVFTDCAKFFRTLKYSVPIIEWVDSISRDERAAPLTQYITNAGITRARYTITHFKHHHRVLRLISNRTSV